MKVKIAVVQFKIVHQQRTVNLKRIEDFIKNAARREAQVIVFPEDCITGSLFGDLSKLDRTHENQEAFCILAKKYHIDVVTGSSMEGTAEGNFNTSYYINAQGEVLAEYRKNHLYPSEYSFLKPGIDAQVFDTAFGKAGIVICWDMLFPEIFERLKNQGVKLIYCPSYWYREIAESMALYNSRSEEQLLDALCLTRAVETNTALVYCNAAGVMNNPNGSVDTLIGHSQIAMPVIGKVHQLKNNRENMFIAEVDLDLLEKSHVIYQA
ncbi:MAG: Nitrilase/cyanide hydratase and apolipoprotein N-acyltransferase [Candidatus Uhrbacteria bacterium GW2011_GWD2_52_7]|uniref:Nitrilase/cyanide hydratase and apolipoprotein N-acyltransferase n=1 Tax=Candidatus Uhrbacteria bacterium GW2011_GWD2_52_7 TaxID=1618989 RepID=A0A0G1XHR5_9BACT|nr:MAG: Nitrilase/cyanide hydratase and apolipoprotein N-acyltransferase [Candidatus Uhrbacteria bacterium GW2011_GWD2_52_7]